MQVEAVFFFHAQCTAAPKQRSCNSLTGSQMIKRAVYKKNKNLKCAVRKRLQGGTAMPGFVSLLRHIHILI